MVVLADFIGVSTNVSPAETPSSLYACVDRESYCRLEPNVSFMHDGP